MFTVEIKLWKLLFVGPSQADYVILVSVATGHPELNIQGETIKLFKQQVDDLQATVLELRTQVERLLSALD
jgi:hypothetical protein